VNSFWILDFGFSIWRVNDRNVSLALFALRAAIWALLVVCGVVAEAQQPKAHRIGVLLSGSSASNASRIAAFRQGLRELGYIEMQNVVIDYRFAEGKLDRFPIVAAELIRLKPDVLVTSGGPGIQALLKATANIPIVMAAIGDAVASGFVKSLAQPGGMVTGLSFQETDVSTKRLEILKQAIPAVTRAAVLRLSSSGKQSVAAILAAAQNLQLKTQVIEVTGSPEFEGAFRAARKGDAEAIMIMASAIFYAHRKELVDLTTKYRWPGIYENKEFVEAGGLMSYGANLDDLFRRAATYVDKILKGAKPPELPVEQATKFELVINLRAAKQIGLTIPPNVLARADRVIR
jgi:putative ABC transport system substrate-binding protein